MTTHRYPRRMEIKRHRLLEAAQEIFLDVFGGRVGRSAIVAG